MPDLPDADTSDAEAEAVYDPLWARRLGTLGDVGGWISTGDDTVYSTWSKYAFVMMTNILTSSMIADTIEYAEYHTHKRCAAITFSGQTFTGKMSVAVGGGLIGVFLTMIGYVPQAQIQKESVLSGLFFGICLLPAIGSLIRIAFMSLFTFTEEKHAEICRLLVERNMSAKILDNGCALSDKQNSGNPQTTRDM